MPKGRQSLRSLMEQSFKMDVIFQEIKGMTPEEAASRIIILTAGKFSPSPPTVQKMVDRAIESGELQPEHLKNPEPVEKSGHRGRASLYDILSIRPDFKEILTNLNGLSPEDASKKISEYDSDLTPSGPTVQKMISRAVEQGDIKENLLKEEEEDDSPKRKGIESAKSKIEKILGISFVDAIRQNCNPKSAVQSIAAKLNDITGVEINTNNVFSYLRDEFSQGNLLEEDFFYEWVKPKRKHEEKKEFKSLESIPKGQEFPVQCECSECNTKRTMVLNDSESFGNQLVIGLRGYRCKGCGRYASFIATIKYQGKTVTKACLEHNDVLDEVFVDNKMNIIPNPFVLEKV